MASGLYPRSRRQHLPLERRHSRTVSDRRLAQSGPPISARLTVGKRFRKRNSDLSWELVAIRPGRKDDRGRAFSRLRGCTTSAPPGRPERRPLPRGHRSALRHRERRRALALTPPPRLATRPRAGRNFKLTLSRNVLEIAHESCRRHTEHTESSPLPPRRLSAIRRRLPYKNASLTPSTKPDGSRRITFAALERRPRRPHPIHWCQGDGDPFDHRRLDALRGPRRPVTLPPQRYCRKRIRRFSRHLATCTGTVPGKQRERIWFSQSRTVYREHRTLPVSRRAAGARGRRPPPALASNSISRPRHRVRLRNVSFLAVNSHFARHRLGGVRGAVLFDTGGQVDTGSRFSTSGHCRGVARACGSSC